jgi:hypothetical protein
MMDIPEYTDQVATHAVQCCGPSALTLTYHATDGDIITLDGPIDIGTLCLCGWTATIHTTLLDFIAQRRTTQKGHAPDGPVPDHR